MELRTASPQSFNNIGPRWMLITRVNPSTAERKPVEQPKGEPYPHKHAWIVRWTKGRKVIEADTMREMERKLGVRNVVSYALQKGRLINGGRLAKIPAPKVRI